MSAAIRTREVLFASRRFHGGEVGANLVETSIPAFPFDAAAARFPAHRIQERRLYRGYGLRDSGRHPTAGKLAYLGYRRSHHRQPGGEILSDLQRIGVER